MPSFPEESYGVRQVTDAPIVQIMIAIPCFCCTSASWGIVGAPPEVDGILLVVGGAISSINLIREVDDRERGNFGRKNRRHRRRLYVRVMFLVSLYYPCSSSLRCERRISFPSKYLNVYRRWRKGRVSL